MIRVSDVNSDFNDIERERKTEREIFYIGFWLLHTYHSLNRMIRNVFTNLVEKNSSNEHLQKFKTISNRCDNVLIKLISLYSIQLFPNISDDELPEIKLTESSTEQVSVVV